MTWRLPWVSRAAYERELVNNQGLFENIRREIARTDAAEDRYTDLLARYHELATPKPPLITVQAEPPEILIKEADPISTVIREQAGKDTQLAAHLRRYANDLKRQGKSRDEIIGELVNWQTSEPKE